MKKTPLVIKKRIPFYKIQGAGNDMLVVEAKNIPSTRGAEKSMLFSRLCHRQLGIGADQLLEVLSVFPKPLKIQIWNIDGSKAEMCANGGRTFLSLAKTLQWIPPKSTFSFWISGRKCRAKETPHGFNLELGSPILAPKQELCVVGANRIPFWRVSVGNPHAVILCAEKTQSGGWKPPRDFSLFTFGPAIETNRLFPLRTNVEFVRSWKAQKDHVEASVDVWERGAGATLSCGSGAMAVAAVLRAETGKNIFKIKMTNFILTVTFDSQGNASLAGPWQLVAQGFYFLE